MTQGPGRGLLAVLLGAALLLAACAGGRGDQGQAAELVTLLEQARDSAGAPEGSLPWMRGVVAIRMFEARCAAPELPRELDAGCTRGLIAFETLRLAAGSIFADAELAFYEVVPRAQVEGVLGDRGGPVEALTRYRWLSERRRLAAQTLSREMRAALASGGSFRTELRGWNERLYQLAAGCDDALRFVRLPGLPTPESAEEMIEALDCLALLTLELEPDLATQPPADARRVVERYQQQLEFWLPVH